MQHFVGDFHVAVGTIERVGASHLAVAGHPGTQDCSMMTLTACVPYSVIFGCIEGVMQNQAFFE